MMRQLKLGLIGDNIMASRAPALHRAAGRTAGIEVTYDLLVPKDRAMSFTALYDWARQSGYDGLNITYPYKEQVFELVAPNEQALQALGALNTVRFTPDGAQGFNTDHSGFLNAYRTVFGTQPPGAVCLIGCGGVGRAIGVALAQLGASAISCVDLDLARAERLAGDLQRAFPTLRARGTQEAGTAAGISGFLNCTALGMEGIGGTALKEEQMQGADWAFDAVYTPRDTTFLNAAKSAGLKTMSGYELFLWQGVDAWEVFANQPTDVAALRAALEAK